MGTWGPGIFDCDESEDFAGNIADRLIGTIEKRLRQLGQNPLAEAELNAAIAIYASAAEKIDAFRLSLAPRRVERWAEVYFDWFDRESSSFIEDQDVPAFRLEREAQFRDLFRNANGDEAIDEAISERLERFHRNEDRDLEL